MVDATTDAARNAGKSPEEGAGGVFAFAGLVLDLDACTLNRESGEAIPLTRGEFALLREFVRRPGRVLSRDLLLDAMAGRRNAPFDRSVDVMVGRQRKKVEPDPKQPSVIQTVPGEGYRFTAPLSSRQSAGESIAARTPASPGNTVIRPPASTPQTWRALWPVLAAAVALCLVAAAAAIQWRSTPEQVGPRLSIVVLPFENMSGDKEQDYFADGITDDLTTDLSHLDGSFVISRGTAFTYKGKAVDAKTIGRELGVRYVLEGSVRRLGDKVEVNAQLVSTETGAHVWADRFEGERGKLGELQLDVVSRLANSLGVELVKAEALRSMRERPGDPDAVDLAMQAEVKEHSYSSDRKAVIDEAVGLSERSLALDPQNVRALTALTNALVDRVSDQYSDDREGDLARAEKSIDAALALQPDNSSAHLAKSNLYFEKRLWGPSIAEAETAVADNPNNASAHANAGFNRLFLGRSEEGFAGVEAAFRLAAQLQKVFPGFTTQTWLGIYCSDDPTFNAQYQRIIEGLRKAGVPEGEARKE